MTGVQVGYMFTIKNIWWTVVEVLGEPYAVTIGEGENWEHRKSGQRVRIRNGAGAVRDIELRGCTPLGLLGGSPGSPGVGPGESCEKGR